MAECIGDICWAGQCQPPGHMLRVPGICTTKRDSTEHIGRGTDASPPFPPTPQRNRMEQTFAAWKAVVEIHWPLGKDLIKRGSQDTSVSVQCCWALMSLMSYSSTSTFVSVCVGKGWGCRVFCVLTPCIAHQNQEMERGCQSWCYLTWSISDSLEVVSFGCVSHKQQSPIFTL